MTRKTKVRNWLTLYFILYFILLLVSPMWFGIMTGFTAGIAVMFKDYKVLWKNFQKYM